jgi:hypothetical protein
MRYAAVAALCLLAAGCGGKHKFVPVSGRITMDGQPLAHVHVEFRPQGEDPGPTSYGSTDADGRFTLKVASQQFSGDGAVPGKHRVSVCTILQGEAKMSTDPSLGSEDGAGLGGKELIPARYNDQTTLEFDVPPGGTDQADFQLEPGRKKPAAKGQFGK